jgi:hypothetical protein
MGFVENINTLAVGMSPANIANMQVIIDTVVPYMPEVLLAGDNAIIATTKAAEATADVVLTHADVATTNSDVVLTHADVVLTHEDVALTHANVVITNADVVTCTTQANAAILASNSAQVDSLVVSAYGNLDWAGFIYNDGELIVNYFNSSTSTPSLVDGEFIITY